MNISFKTQDLVQSRSLLITLPKPNKQIINGILATMAAVILNKKVTERAVSSIAQNLRDAGTNVQDQDVRIVLEKLLRRLFNGCAHQDAHQALREYCENNGKSHLLDTLTFLLNLGIKIQQELAETNR